MISPGGDKDGRVDVDMRPEHERVFREIFEGNEKWLYQYIARRIGDPSHTEDILQEVAVVFLFRFYDFLPGYPDNANQVGQWLIGVAENKVKHYWRKHYRTLEMEISAELLPDLGTWRDEISDVELDLPTWLGPEERRMLVLKCMGYNLKEIADQMGISHSTCRMRSSRLVKKLKKYFDE